MNVGHVENASGIEVDLEKLAFVLDRTKSALGIQRLVAVRLVDEHEIVGLNDRFRHCPEATDVLTFPSGLDDPLPIGDIAICVPYARAQARLRKVDLDNELAALLIHGCLHLIGYDDETDDDRTEMQRKMNEVGSIFGIPIEAEWTSVLHQAHEDGEK